MTERNPYSQQFRFDSYDQPGRAGEEGESFKDRVVAKLTSPVFATGALLLTAAAFAGIIMASYPDSPAEDVPVIQASAGDIHAAPPENGGLEVPYQDSTVFNNIRSAELEEQAPVEDLLAEEKPIDKLEAFAKEAESMFDEGKAAKAKAPAVESAEAEITETVAAEEPAAGEITPPQPAANDNSQPAGKTIKIEQTVEKIPPQVKTSADAAATTAVKPAGSAPETLEFVKSVLNEKDGKTGAAPQAQTVNTQSDVTQPALQKIEPAAGVPSTSGSAIVPGSYYVQLGSVTSEDGAGTEWKRLQKSFASLSGTQYRVQKADLGEKGVRYRIQAGPMEKDMASNVCDAIKVQKPGGCIVVQ